MSKKQVLYHRGNAKKCFMITPVLTGVHHLDSVEMEIFRVRNNILFASVVVFKIGLSIKTTF